MNTSILIVFVVALAFVIATNIWLRRRAVRESEEEKDEPSGE